MARRCLICSNLNPCREHSEDAQDAELERNRRECAAIFAERARHARTSHEMTEAKPSADTLNIRAERAAGNVPAPQPVATADVERLRMALIDCGRQAGAVLSDTVSTDFLLLIPDELRAKIAALSKPVEPAPPGSVS